MTACPKPIWNRKHLQQARKRLADTRTKAAKAAAKLRDGMASRYPGVPQDGSRLESGHLCHSGAGGNPSGSRSHQARDYVTLTAKQHARQHAGYLSMGWGVDGGDGEVLMFERVSLSAPWVLVGSSSPKEMR